MKTMNFYRKPYLAYLIGLMFLVVSCKQYDNFNEQNELVSVQKIDLKKIKSEFNNYYSLTKNKKITTFNEFQQYINGHNKTSNDDFEQAKNALIQLGWQEGADFDENQFFDNATNILIQKQLISIETKVFLQNTLMTNGYISETDVSNYISSNSNLTSFEIDFINSIVIEQNRINNCGWFGVGMGFIAGCVVSATGWGWCVSGLASAFVGVAAADVCEAIAAQL